MSFLISHTFSNEEELIVTAAMMRITWRDLESSGFTRPLKAGLANSFFLRLTSRRPDLREAYSIWCDERRLREMCHRVAGTKTAYYIIMQLTAFNPYRLLGLDIRHGVRNSEIGWIARLMQVSPETVAEMRAALECHGHYHSKHNLWFLLVGILAFPIVGSIGANMLWLIASRAGPAAPGELLVWLVEWMAGMVGITGWLELTRRVFRAAGNGCAYMFVRHQNIDLTTADGLTLVNIFRRLEAKGLRDELVKEQAALQVISIDLLCDIDAARRLNDIKKEWITRLDSLVGDESKMMEIVELNRYILMIEKAVALEEREIQDANAASGSMQWHDQTVLSS